MSHINIFALLTSCIQSKCPYLYYISLILQGVLMENISKIIYRNLTDADFFNINKPRGMEDRGGGQTYIDFPIRNVNIENWELFFESVINVEKNRVAQGPSWSFPIYSIGLDREDSLPSQTLKVYQRRPASVSISSQKLGSSGSNRVRAWHPDFGFPYPLDNTLRNLAPEGLMVYLALTTSGKVWAGWYLNDGTTPLPFSGECLAELDEMFETNLDQDGRSGFISIPQNSLYLDAMDLKLPLKSGHLNRPLLVSGPESNTGDEQHIDEQFLEDTSAIVDPSITTRVIQVRKRNKRLVSKLKNLYQHKCQVTGEDFLFQKKNGTNYTEAHHLIPLGDGGSDRAENLIVICPQIHSMLHHARVSGLDLNNIYTNSAGYGYLDITINEKPYTIEWLPAHAALFE
ncbi:HNH endonuclease [Aliivibrio sp. S10_S31]|uniref:HNH endonuclease n=1 Tax=Aliivibrio sp. S10_S31 TaxID=2720224 RepID=UPI0019325152|nr:HNH endonuclease [Aliivibrio sp. S10_S31]